MSNYINLKGKIIKKKRYQIDFLRTTHILKVKSKRTFKAVYWTIDKFMELTIFTLNKDARFPILILMYTTHYNWTYISTVGVNTDFLVIINLINLFIFANFLNTNFDIYSKKNRFEDQTLFANALSKYDSIRKTQTFFSLLFLITAFNQEFISIIPYFAPFGDIEVRAPVLGSFVIFNIYLFIRTLQIRSDCVRYSSSDQWLHYGQSHGLSDFIYDFIPSAFIFMCNYFMLIAFLVQLKDTIKWVTKAYPANPSL